MSDIVTRAARLAAERQYSQAAVHHMIAGRLETISRLRQEIQYGRVIEAHNAHASIDYMDWTCELCAPPVVYRDPSKGGETEQRLWDGDR